ncbi:hypothetical protein M413DRAFT_350396 [Hebeloma cylindrosporum]|uniref:Uncharacterized protein n=1 Tax=Hebeloma cylindrosporum TaxID=76867 RepID=A0A0C3BEX4_HEBCY|nr:hypothetical protein M413DRAFT_350396 [Hebeloma cylindrosporum h7]
MNDDCVPGAVTRWCENWAWVSSGRFFRMIFRRFLVLSPTSLFFPSSREFEELIDTMNGWIASVWRLVGPRGAAAQTTVKLSFSSVHAPFHDIPPPYTRVQELISDFSNDQATFLLPYSFFNSSIVLWTDHTSSNIHTDIHTILLCVPCVS